MLHAGCCCREETTTPGAKTGNVTGQFHDQAFVKVSVSQLLEGRHHVETKNEIVYIIFSRTSF